jgi:hypothetical protein
MVLWFGLGTARLGYAKGVIGVATNGNAVGLRVQRWFTPSSLQC